MLSGELYTQKIFSSLKYIFSLLFSLLPCSVFVVVIGWNQISLYDLLPFIAHLGTQKCTDKWFICQVWKALALLKLSKHTKWIRSQSQHQFCYNIKFLFLPILLLSWIKSNYSNEPDIKLVRYIFTYLKQDPHPNHQYNLQCHRSSNRFLYMDHGNWSYQCTNICQTCIEIGLHHM